MGRLSANMLTELRSASPDVHPLLVVDWSSGTKRYARVGDGIASRTLGTSTAEVETFGTPSRSVRDRANSLQSWSMTVDVRDWHFDLANIFALHDPLNTPARIYLASNNVAQADWFKVCEGVLTGFDGSGSRSWTLTIGPNEAPLRSPLLRIGLHPGIISTLPTDKRGVLLPLCIGRHDTSGEAGKGKLATIWVGNSGTQSQHVLCLGWVPIQRVYVDGVKSATSAYTVTYENGSGVAFTMITFTSDKSANAITVDACGYTVAPTTTPDVNYLVQAPGAAIRLLLANWVYEYNTAGGSYFDSASGLYPIDTDAFNALDAAAAGGLGYRAGGVSYVASRFIDGQSTGLSELNSWAASHEVKIFWRNDGLLSCGLDDPTLYATSASPWLQRDRNRGLSRMFPTDSLAKEVDVTYGLAFTNAVQDTRSRSDAVDAVSLDWGPNFE